jgi:hypothetical protein
MAQDAGKDRAAIKSDIALSRQRMGTELSGLRYELDFPRKFKDSFRHHLVIWTGASAVAGILIAVAPARTTKVYVRPKSRKKGEGEGLVEAGAAVGILRFAGTLLRPMIVKFVTNKMRGDAGSRPGAPR